MSAIFSNNRIWWIAPYYRASDMVGREKKGKFHEIFRDRFAKILVANFAEKQSVKNGQFHGNFVGNFRHLR